jgi:Indole-3-glycerol phosphate synthase
MGMPPPEIVGGALRDAGAKAIVVSLDKRSGGASTEDFHRFTKEQARARILVPGPLPIVWHDHIVHIVQIQQAASLGAAAIVLTPALVDNLSEFIASCKSYDIEPIVLVKDYTECKLAMDGGARCLCMNGLEESELVALRQQLPNDPAYCYIAKLRPETDFSIYGEIDTAWVLRDNGFNCVWPSPDAIFATGMGDMYSAVIAIKSKASRMFVSPRQFMMDRTKEGAKEYLGDILY